MGEDEPAIRVGQLWRRRYDGRAFIPAHRTADGHVWLDRHGIKRTATDLRAKYVLVPLGDEPWPSAKWRSRTGVGARTLPSGTAKSPPSTPADDLALD